MSCSPSETCCDTTPVCKPKQPPQVRLDPTTRMGAACEREKNDFCMIEFNYHSLPE